MLIEFFWQTGFLESIGYWGSTMSDDTKIYENFSKLLLAGARDRRLGRLFKVPQWWKDERECCSKYYKVFYPFEIKAIIKILNKHFQTAMWPSNPRQFNNPGLDDTKSVIQIVWWSSIFW